MLPEGASWGLSSAPPPSAYAAASTAAQAVAGGELSPPLAQGLAPVQLSVMTSSAPAEVSYVCAYSRVGCMCSGTHSTSEHCRVLQYEQSAPLMSSCCCFLVSGPHVKSATAHRLGIFCQTVRDKTLRDACR